MKENNTNTNAAMVEDIEINGYGITSRMIKEAQDRENPDRYISPLRKGDIALAPIDGQGIKALWARIGATDEDCARLTAAAGIDKCRLTPDQSSAVLRKHADGAQVAAINKWCVEVRRNGAWITFADFARDELRHLVPTSHNWKTANDIAFVIREGFIRRKGASAFVKVKKSAAALESENAKLLEELRELKAELAKK